MHIWVDADACPLAVKEILYRAALVVDPRDFLEKLRETGDDGADGLA